MPDLTPDAREKMRVLDKRLRQLIRELSLEWNLAIIETFRSKEKQDAAVASGHSKLHWPNSPHNHEPCRAVDMAPAPVDYSNTRRLIYFAGYVMAKADELGIKLRWGGDWKQSQCSTANEFNDLTHFELAE